MWQNYIKVTFRNLAKNRGLTFINIFGLAIGMVACILILFWVFDELSYDQFFPQSDQIHQICKSYQMGNETSYNQSLPLPLAGFLRSNFEEMEAVTFFRGADALVHYHDKRFMERRICQSDADFFKVFKYNFIYGNAATALANPNSIVITEEIAQKYFDEENPVGKVINLNNSTDYVVTGVLANVPKNSSYQYNIFMQMPPDIQNNFTDDWGNQWVRVFTLLKPNTDLAVFNSKLEVLAAERLQNEKISFLTRPLSRLHLYTIDGRPEGMKYIYFFSIIALFILIIACINFTNLSTARSIERAREIGMRKVIGAEKRQIIGQFLGESIINALMALILALVIVELVRPAFNSFTNKAITIGFTDLKIIGLFIGSAIITGIFAGLYPALFLSSYMPISILKGNSHSSPGRRNSLRKILVITQFVVAVLLLICTSIIYLQNNYIRHKDLGFKKDNIVYLQLNDKIENNYDAFRNELIKHPDINNVARTSALPTSVFSIARGITWEGKETPEGDSFGFDAVDFEYVNTIGLEVVKGRALSRKYPSDSGSVMINEKAAALLGWNDPIGKNIYFDPESPAPIVGVVKDFNALPLTMEIEPMLLVIYPSFYRYILMDIQTPDTPGTIARIEKVWQQFAPQFPFEYHFLDEEFERDYQSEIRMGKIFGYFVILAIFISCLGLFGLAAFSSQQRRKEIGIRKVQGATVGGLVILLTREFTKWIIIANVIAWPIAWYAMHKWLQHFAYRTEITIWPFLLSGFLTLLIALTTVSFTTIKAAIANPVNSLRYE